MIGSLSPGLSFFSARRFQAEKPPERCERQGTEIGSPPELASLRGTLPHTHTCLCVPGSYLYLSMCSSLNHASKAASHAEHSVGMRFFSQGRASSKRFIIRHAGVFLLPCARGESPGKVEAATRFNLAILTLTFPALFHAAHSAHTSHHPGRMALAFGLWVGESLGLMIDVMLIDCCCLRWWSALLCRTTRNFGG